MKFLRAMGARPGRWAIFALALFVLDTLAPAVSAFAGGAPPAAFVEVCTSTGIRRIATGGDVPVPPAKTCFKCPLCAVAGAHGLIDQPYKAWASAAPTGFERAEAPAARPAATRGPRPPPARAPPAFS